MKVYIILNICLIFIASLDDNSVDREIKYKIINYPFSSFESNEDKFDPNLQLSEGNSIIELESECIITQISWAKKENYKYNYLLGVFEVSNNPTFEDGIPIAIIKEQGDLNTINYIDINSPTSYKYLDIFHPIKTTPKFFQLNYLAIKNIK